MGDVVDIAANNKALYAVKSDGTVWSTERKVCGYRIAEGCSIRTDDNGSSQYAISYSYDGRYVRLDEYGFTDT